MFYRDNKDFSQRKLQCIIDNNIAIISSFVNSTITEDGNICLISQEGYSHVRKLSFLYGGGIRDPINVSGTHQTAEKLLKKLLKDQSGEQSYLILSLTICRDANEIWQGHKAARHCQYREESCSEN